MSNAFNVPTHPKPAYPKPVYPSDKSTTLIPNKALIFASLPETYPVPGTNLVVEDIKFAPDHCPQGTINVEVLYVSLDPYMRGRMRDPSVKSYFPAYQLDEPLSNAGIGRVTKSSHPKFAQGDVIMGYLPFCEHVNIDLDKEGDRRKLEKVDEENGPPDMRDWVGALGMPGLTAYSSLYEIGKPKSGETIFISSAAGAVGQLVGQLAKHEGMRVIGSVGSDEKLRFLTEELGFDGGFNYKTEKPLDALTRLCPEGVDIYYENVGGEQLEAALEVLNEHSRIVACGMISQYNVKPEDRYGIKNLLYIFRKRITMRGFIVSDQDMGPKYAKEHREKVTNWLRDGMFKTKVSEWVGVEEGGNAVVGMLKGENFGKAILKIKV